MGRDDVSAGASHRPVALLKTLVAKLSTQRLGAPARTETLIMPIAAILGVALALIFNGMDVGASTEISRSGG